MFLTEPTESLPTVRDGGESDPLCELLLVCRARALRLTEGTWHFALETADGTPVFSASDQEAGDLNRLTLLAAVRGLEAIDGPSSVTLVSSSRYLIRSLADSLPRWRAGGFMWEHFGRRIDVQHADLWRRIDRAISIHQVHACLVSSRQVSVGSGQQQLRVDGPHAGVPEAHVSPPRVRGSQRANESSDPLRRWLMSDVAAPEATSTSVGKPPRQTRTSSVESEPRVIIRNRRVPNTWRTESRESVLQSA